MNETNNKNTLCNIIAVLSIFVIVGLFVEVFINALGNVSVFAAVIAGIFGTAFASIPLAVLITFALKKAPERFNIYVILGLLSYLGTAFFAVLSIALKASGMTERLDFAAGTALLKYSWKDLATGLLMTVCYFILINAMQKQRKGENAYTRKFLICEFVLLAWCTIVTLATKNYADMSAARIIWTVLFFLVNRAIEVCLVLSVKYIEKKENPVNNYNPQPTEETAE